VPVIPPQGASFFMRGKPLHGPCFRASIVREENRGGSTPEQEGAGEIESAFGPSLRTRPNCRCPGGGYSSLLLLRGFV